MIINLGTKLQDDNNGIYVLDNIIGSGGFGTVFRSHSINDSSIVAIKILNISQDNYDSLLSFQKEINLTRLHISDNVIKYLYIHNGKQFPEYPPYLIMEYTDGGTVRDLIKNQNSKQFDIDYLIDLYLQLANGMKCINEQLIHRDIKPDNILNFNGIFKITDFGLSKIIEDKTKTMTFKNFGSSLYIAPEAWNNEHNTIQMDIYSMGIVFYELATLNYPYNYSQDFDLIRIRNMHLYDLPIDALKRNSNLPPNIVFVLNKMLAKSKDDRFKNWDEVIMLLTSKPDKSNYISRFVDKAIAKKNERDLQSQMKFNEINKGKYMKDNVIKLAYSQFLNKILNPIMEFVDSFNSEINNSDYIRISVSRPSGTRNEFNTKILIKNGESISIKGEVLFKDMFSKPYTYPTGQTVMVNYIPQLQNRDIILWCQIEDGEGIGFNILLVKKDNDSYGDWMILENKVHELAIGINKPSPFGFNLDELEEQVQYLNAEHIYRLNLSSFSIDKILDFISDRT